MVALTSHDAVHSSGSVWTDSQALVPCAAAQMSCIFGLLTAAAESAACFTFGMSLSAFSHLGCCSRFEADRHCRSGGCRAFLPWPATGKMHSFAVHYRHQQPSLTSSSICRPSAASQGCQAEEIDASPEQPGPDSTLSQHFTCAEPAQQGHSMLCCCSRRHGCQGPCCGDRQL